VKLSVNLIAGGRYWKAGDDIPDHEIPAFAQRFVIPENGDAASVTPKPPPDVARAIAEQNKPKPRRYVRRGGGPRKCS